jgi:hypothetical protein
MERLRSAPGVGPELDRLDSRLRELEGRLRQLLARQNGAGAEGERPAAKSASELGRSDD